MMSKMKIIRKVYNHKLKKEYFFVAFLFLGNGFLFAQASAGMKLHEYRGDDLTRLLLKGPISRLTEDTFEVYNGSPHPMPIHRKIYSFDTCGRLLEVVQYHPPELFSSEIFTYNVSGKPTGMIAKRFDPPSIIENNVYIQPAGEACPMQGSVSRLRPRIPVPLR